MFTAAELSDEEIYKLYLKFKEALLRDKPIIQDVQIDPDAEDLDPFAFFGIPVSLEAFKEAFKEIEIVPNAQEEIIYQLQKGYTVFKREVEMLMADTDILVAESTDKHSDHLVRSYDYDSPSKRKLRSCLYPWGVLRWFTSKENR